MYFLTAAVIAAVPLACAWPATANNRPIASSYPDTACPWTDLQPLTHDEVVSNFYTLWGGNYDYLNKTFTPDVQLWQDRFPTGNGSAPLPVHDTKQMLDFVKASRADFEQYSFIDVFHFGVGNMVTMRWTLNATFSGSPTAGLAKGSHVAYNGTDIALLDPCSGRISQVLSAQDLITYFHVLQQPVGIV